MGYRIKRREKPAKAAARIAREETEAALAALADPVARSPIESIRDCRTRCRKLRGLVRLIPPDRAKRARRLDRLYRQAARELTGPGDASAALTTFDRLVAATAGTTTDRPDARLAVVRSELARRSSEADAAPVGPTEATERAAGHLSDALGRIDGWGAGRGWDAIGIGLAATYRAGAAHLATLREDPGAGAGDGLHEQAEYTTYHLRLLERSAPSLLTPLAAAFENLVEGLGDADDLAVLRHTLAAQPEAFGGDEVTGPVLALLDDHQRRLRDAAVSSAGRLYAERPQAFARRLEAYWELWRKSGPERPIEPLAAQEATAESAPGAAPDAPDAAPEDGAAAPEEGATAPEDGAAAPEDGADGADGLDELTVAELRALAREAGLTGHSRSRRAVLLGELRRSGIAAPGGVPR